MAMAAIDFDYVTVIVVTDRDGNAFAQGIETDHAVDGDSVDDALSQFRFGLVMLLVERGEEGVPAWPGPVLDLGHLFFDDDPVDVRLPAVLTQISTRDIWREAERIRTERETRN